MNKNIINKNLWNYDILIVYPFLSDNQPEKCSTYKLSMLFNTNQDSGCELLY